MRSNGLLKWLMIPVVLLLLLVFIKLLPSSKTPVAGPEDRESQLSADEMKALGLEGDTPSDTVATLVAQVRQLRAELKDSQGEGPKSGDADSNRLFEERLDQRIQQALEEERQRLQNEHHASEEVSETKDLLQDLQRQLDGLSQRDRDADIPVGFGLEGDDGQHFNNGLRWIEPQDVKPKDPDEPVEQATSFPTRFGPAQKALGSMADTIASTGSQDIERSPAKPTYTVPPNATLMGSVTMTALIGRIPIDGTVNDPYPFKVLIGADNLTANGIDLPDIAGAVVSGTASGDWTLSCVRGQIRSITFVFQDGTIRTLPADTENDSRSNKQNSSNSGATQEGLGWLSDKHGIPCVAGKRRSNAQQYLGSQALITAAGVGVASLIKSDGNNTIYSGSNSGTGGAVSISGSEAMNRMLSSGVKDISQWVSKLYGQAFAAVYVEPGAQVSVHIEQPLTLDYDAEGRKVDHTPGGRHVTTDLD
ncbi:TIGR03752 family integrating conjugative element protein [Pseudomonas koreensis]|uniref:TIGR03752 family integrating conjugative element protein n=1 Tax=Pseudomonas koreensis TaxID=198620 RepID=A0A9X2XE91_9PSED|nr:TIGR03752 family integrating conjugative element protein [Pseudomonas koreensis]MCU7247296.1 TIGR03752 family integrating conjugative element protein [Pseudomonas koreensis]